MVVTESVELGEAVWRNERWKAMITPWCGTAVGRATFKISTWEWMINPKIRQYLSVDDSKWQLQPLFYPEKQSRRGETTRQRRPDFLVSLDDDAFREVYDFLANRLETKFSSIRRLTCLSSQDGRLLAQVLDHVIDWLGLERTPAANRRDNKKPLYRRDLVPSLQHFNLSLVSQARRRVAFICLDSDKPEASPASDASVVMQQELVDFIIDHIEAFRTPAVRVELAQRQEADTEEAYKKCFLREEWAQALAIVRWYAPSDFRPEWQYPTEERQSNVETKEAQQDLAKAMLKFVSGKEGEVDREAQQRMSRDPDLRQKLERWLTEQYGKDDDDGGEGKQGRERLECAAYGQPMVGIGGSENASRDAKLTTATSADEEQLTTPEETEVVGEKSPVAVQRRVGSTSHHSLSSRTRLPGSRPDLRSFPGQAVPSSSQGKAIHGPRQQNGLNETRIADAQRVSVSNPTRLSSPFAPPKPGARRNGLRAKP
ncbi:hypothetical protein HJFPF1_10729 [Paramyrothecium foliicola]|nr:hypothetical protein HJFPF1_10729 [Paramyrothecium foliicola]